MRRKPLMPRLERPTREKPDKQMLDAKLYRDTPRDEDYFVGEFIFPTLSILRDIHLSVGEAPSGAGVQNVLRLELHSEDGITVSRELPFKKGMQVFDKLPEIPFKGTLKLFLSSDKQEPIKDVSVAIGYVEK